MGKKNPDLSGSESETLLSRINQHWLRSTGVDFYYIFEMGYGTKFHKEYEKVAPVLPILAASAPAPATKLKREEG